MKQGHCSGGYKGQARNQHVPACMVMGVRRNMSIRAEAIIMSRRAMAPDQRRGSGSGGAASGGELLVQKDVEQQREDVQVLELAVGEGVVRYSLHQRRGVRLELRVRAAKRVGGGVKSRAAEQVLDSRGPNEACEAAHRQAPSGYQGSVGLCQLSEPLYVSQRDGAALVTLMTFQRSTQQIEHVSMKLPRLSVGVRNQA